MFFFNPADPSGSEFPRLRRITLRLSASGRSWTNARLSWIEGDVPARIDVKRSLLAAAGTLAFPSSVRSVTIEADHHRALTIELPDNLEAEVFDAGVVRLEPLPVITGKIVAGEDGLPLAGVSISAENAEPTTTNHSGNFELDVTGRWPQQVTASIAGRADRVVTVPPAAREVSIGRIALDRNGTVRVRCPSCPEFVAELSPSRGEPPNASGTIISGADLREEAIFASVAPGPYRLLVKGGEVLQRLALPVEVAAGEETSVVVDVTPIDFELRVRRKDEPVAAEVSLIHSESWWKETIRTGADGRFTAQLWQAGDYHTITKATEGSAFVQGVSVASSGPVRADILLPASEVSVSVVDSRTGQPIGGASILMEALEDPVGFFEKETDAEGRAVFVSLERNSFEITVAAEGFVSTRSKIRLTEPDEQIEVRMPLRRGAVCRLRVVASTGAPLSGAMVLPMPARLTEMTSTDGSGLAQFISDRPGVAEVLVLPATSFAFRQVACEETDGEPKVTEISIPPGDATIRLRAVTTDGEPIPGVNFLLRIDGRMASMEILEALQISGKRFRTGDDGWAIVGGLPSGLYEFWPFFTGADVEGIWGGSGPAPVVVGARPGDNTATLTFAREPGTRQ